MQDVEAPVRPDRWVTGLRLAGIVLLVLAWFAAAPLLLVFRSALVGVVVGLPSAICFALAYRRSRAGGNLVGVGLALATPLVWFALWIAALGGADLS